MKIPHKEFSKNYLNPASLFRNNINFIPGAFSFVDRKFALKIGIKLAHICLLKL